MDDILAKKNRHLFLEEKDNVGNSFIANVNKVAASTDVWYALKDHTDEIETVADNIDDVHTVAENIDNVNTVADNIDDIEFVHSNIEDGTLEALLDRISNEGNDWLLRIAALGNRLLNSKNAFNYAAVATIPSDIAANATITLPESMSYLVGTHMLLLSWNGTVCYKDEQYKEIGTTDTWSTTIKTLVPLKAGDKLEFRTVAVVPADTQVIATGSLENRTLADRFGDICNVKDFGAVGDGIENDTAAFQAALATGKAVFVPEGSYKLTTNLTGDFCATGNSTFTGGTINGSTILRGIAQRNSDIINVKDFGAKGDGTTDDTAAWDAWQSTLQTKGIGYVPPGQYLVDGVVKSFPFGCLGNALSIDTSGYYVYPGQSVPVVSPPVANPAINPLIKDYTEYEGDASWSPRISLNFKGTKNGDGLSGPDGLRIIGEMVGSGPAFAHGIYAYMRQAVDGDGDSVAVSGTVEKSDPSGALNDSDSCGVHAKCFNNSNGGGLVMAAEFWSHVGSGFVPKADTASTKYGKAYNENDGCTTIIHMNAYSNAAKTTWGIRAAGRTGYSYGLRDFISIDKGAFLNGFDGNGDPVKPTLADGSSIIKCPDIGENYGPYYGFYLGYLREGLKIQGNSNFNVFCDNIVLSNNTETVGNSTTLRIRQWVSPDDTEHTEEQQNGRTCKILFEKDVTSRVPNDSNSVKLGDIYCRNNGEMHIRNRTLNQPIDFSHTTGSGTVVTYGMHASKFFPNSNGSVNLGDTQKRWDNVYASGTVSTSDERRKQQIDSIPDAVLDAWGEVEWEQFKFNSAVERKGESARKHTGAIAQKILRAFEGRGLDATEYGLLCYDEWEASEAVYEYETVIDEEPEYDGETLIKAGRSHEERHEVSPARPASNLYSLRYEEALCMEAAYQRRRAARLEERLALLEERVNQLTNNQDS